MRNLILTGGIFHPFEEAATALADAFAEVGVDSEVSFDMEGGLTRVAAGEFDLVTIYALRWRMLDHDKYLPYRDQWAFSMAPQHGAALAEFVANGGGLLGLHTASICFDDWPGWKTLLGGVWHWGVSYHPPTGPIRAQVASYHHPIVAGVQELALSDEIYHHLDLEPDIRALLTGAAAGEPPQPLLWAREVAQGRVVYDALGHDAASINNAVHRRILQRALLWVAGRSDDEIAALQ